MTSMNFILSRILAIAILLGYFSDSFAQQNIEDFFPVEVESLYVGRSGKSSIHNQSLQVDGCRLIIEDSNSGAKLIKHIHIRDFVTEERWVQTHSFLPGQQHYHRKKYVYPPQATEKLTRITWLIRDSQSVNDAIKQASNQTEWFSSFRHKSLGPDELLEKAQIIEGYLQDTLNGVYGLTYQRNHQARYTTRGRFINKIRSKYKNKTELLKSVSPLGFFDLTVSEDVAHDVIQAMHRFNESCIPE